MRIATYNIRKAIGLDWRRNPKRILDVLAEMDADVVVLQEADRRLGARSGVLPIDELQNRLGYQIADVLGHPLSHGWHGNAIFLKQKLSLIDAFKIDLPKLEPRGAVGVTLKHGLTIIGAHLGLTRKMRTQQIAALVAHARSTEQSCLVAGDFNEWQSERISDAILPDYRVELPGKSFHAARLVACLDGFFLPADIRVIKSAVHHSSLAATASDHLPVYVDIESSML